MTLQQVGSLAFLLLGELGLIAGAVYYFRKAVKSERPNPRSFLDRTFNENNKEESKAVCLLKGIVFLLMTLFGLWALLTLLKAMSFD